MSRASKPERASSTEPDGPSRLDDLRQRFGDRLARYQNVPIVGLGVDLYQRDQESAGSMVGSAVAFRLFTYFVPLLLFLVGLAGFLSGHIDAEEVNANAGISGGLANQMRTALNQSGRTPWIITFLGLFGMITAGRSLSRVLVTASGTAWRMPLKRKSSWRIVGSVSGLVAGMGMVAILVNRARSDLGIGAATLSFGPAYLIYVVAWVVIGLLLPRRTEDPGAVLPGAAFVAAVLTGMQAVSQFYLPERFSKASQLYGAIGTTVVTLGWFFILGRAIVIGVELNAVTYERYGSVSTVAFSLPVLRILPRRSRRLREFFDLDGPDGGGRPDRVDRVDRADGPGADRSDAGLSDDSA